MLFRRANPSAEMCTLQSRCEYSPPAFPASPSEPVILVLSHAIPTSVARSQRLRGGAVCNPDSEFTSSSFLPLRKFFGLTSGAREGGRVRVVVVIEPARLGGSGGGRSRGGVFLSDSFSPPSFAVGGRRVRAGWKKRKGGCIIPPETSRPATVDRIGLETSSLLPLFSL